MSKDKYVRARDLNAVSVDRNSSPQPLAIEPTGTFTRAIMVEAPDHVARRSVNYAISLVVHFGTIFALVVLPLVLSNESQFTMFTTPAFVTVPSPPPKDPPGSRAHTVYRDDNHIFPSVKLTAPIFNVNRFLLAPEILPPAEPLKPVPSGTPGGISDVLGGILEETSSPLVAPVLRAFPPNAHAVQLGGALETSRLVSGLTLVYPEIAKLAHIFGRVVIEAIIDERGKVTNVRAISGPTLLTSAAIDAVSHERFQPTLLNGLPIRCGLTVLVSFHLEDARSN